MRRFTGVEWTGSTEIGFALLLVQAGSTAVTAVGMLAVAAVETDPNALVTAALTLGVLGVQLAVAVGVMGRRRWARPAALVLQAVALLATAIGSTVFQGPPMTLAAVINDLVLPLATIAVIAPWPRSVRRPRTVRVVARPKEERGPQAATSRVSEG